MTLGGGVPAGSEPAEPGAAGAATRLFAISEIGVPARTGARAPGGVPQADYAGRPDVRGRLNPGTRLSLLLLNGHADVVPAGPAQWRTEPFAPVITSGGLAGRGAGDMTGGFAVGLRAVAALRAATPGALSGELSFLSVIEEECGLPGALHRRDLKAAS